MDVMMESAVGLAVLNSAVLLGLLVLYARIASRSRALYPVGLMVFAVVLLAQNLTTVYSYLSMTPFFGEAVVPYLLAISALEFGGLLARAKVTVQP